MLAGLRIDVDTLRGTKSGVPRLLSILEEFGIKATFFFSVGPDNMGRHLWRLFRPAFLLKMLRTGAPSLYGWSILRCGVIGQGPDIGHSCADIIRRTGAEGHEVGLHAWDHQRWQSMDMTSQSELVKELERGFSRLMEITGAPPSTSASPAWRTPELALAAKHVFPFSYNSDCRGSDCFLPTDGINVFQPQVPVTLPTYDEMCGRNGVFDANYNECLLELFRPDGLNVLCIHAEAEGIAKAPLFENFLTMARARGISFTRLGEIVKNQGKMRIASTCMRSIPERDSLMCFQGEWVGREKNGRH